MNILAIQSFGSLINVEGDGICGYHAIKELLVQQNIRVDYQSLVLNLLMYEDFLPLILPQCQKLVQ